MEVPPLARRAMALVVHAGIDAALDATGEHQAVCVWLERQDSLIDTLKAGRGALEIAVVKGEHDGAAILGIEHAAEAVLETPVILMSALEEEARGFLRNVGEVFLFFLSAALRGDVSHGRG